MQPNVETLIEAARRLPPADRRRLAEALAETRSADSATTNSSPSSRSRRGFPISKGRVPFTSADVDRIESDSTN
jgi:hypothetical protein